MLSREQVDRFWSDGYLAVDKLVDTDTVEELRGYYDRILSKDIDLGEQDRMLGGLTRQVMIPSQKIEFFKSNPALDEAKRIAADLFSGGSAALTYDMLISKEPGNTEATAWHQDFAYSQRPFAPAGTAVPNTNLQFWVPLDDVDEETGCMQFIPAAHAGGLREHYVYAGDPAEEGRMLATKDVDPAEAVACPLPAGGCTVHTDGTLHFTSGNRSTARPRRAYIFNLKPA